MALFGLFGQEAPPRLWQADEIRFDAPSSSHRCRPGEMALEVQHVSNREARHVLLAARRSTHTAHTHTACVMMAASACTPSPPATRSCLAQGVEDAKGNPGDAGRLTITNLRIMWASSRAAATNLSIGHGCILDTSVQHARSRLRGEGQVARYCRPRFALPLPPASMLSPGCVPFDCMLQTESRSCKSSIAFAVPAATRTPAIPAPCLMHAGHASAIRILTSFKSQRYEFIFSGPAEQTAQRFATMQARTLGQPSCQLRCAEHCQQCPNACVMRQPLPPQRTKHQPGPFPPFLPPFAPFAWRRSAWLGAL